MLRWSIKAPLLISIKLLHILSFIKIIMFNINYRVKWKLAPKSQNEVLEADYYTFTVVRHPFDRVLSAFRNRILNGCTWQAKKHIPKIIQKNKLKYDQKGCVVTLPTFRQFVDYILFSKSRRIDPHWSTYASGCAPCLVNYDAILKLETSEEDEGSKMYLLISLINQ